MMKNNQTLDAKKRLDKIDQGRRKFFATTLPVTAGAIGLGVSFGASSAQSVATDGAIPTKSLERQVIEGAPWQSGYGFVQGNVISGPHRMFHMAGQGPTNEHGEVLYPNDMKGQVSATLDNMERALKQANMSWSDVINLSVYTTDMSGFFEVYQETLHKRVVVDGGAKFGGALLQISGFAFPDMKIEIVGLAVSAI